MADPQATPSAQAPAEPTVAGPAEVLPGVIGNPARMASKSDAAPAGSTAAPPSADPGSAATSPAATDPAAAGVASGGDSSPAPAPEAPATGWWTALDPRFKDEAHALHSIKTLRGMHAANERRIEKERLEKLELRQELDRMRSQIERGGPPAGASTPGKGQQPATAAAGSSGGDAEVDWNLFDTLYTKHSPRVALEWLQGENGARQTAAVKTAVEAAVAELREQVKPALESAAMAQKQGQAVSLLERLSNYRYADGSEAYPEIKDPKAMGEIGALWDDLGLSQEEILTPKGFHLAVAAYRDNQALRARTASPKTPTTRPASAAVASGVVSTTGDRGSRDPASPPAALDPAMRIAKAPLYQDDFLGIPSRRPQQRSA